MKRKRPAVSPVVVLPNFSISVCSIFSETCCKLDPMHYHRTRNIINDKACFSSSVAVQQLGPEEDNVVRAFLQLRDKYYEQFKKNWDWDKLY